MTVRHGRQPHWRGRRQGTGTPPGETHKHDTLGPVACVVVFECSMHWECLFVGSVTSMLNVSGNYVGAEGAMALGPHLAKLTNMTDLSLGCAFGAFWLAMHAPCVCVGLTAWL